MATDELALRRIDHVRMFVGNARQSAYFYRNAFGFEVVAYAGLETGVRNEACYVLKQGEITFVLASPLHGDHPDAQRLVRHGDGVQTIALEVKDVKVAFEAAVRRGELLIPPKSMPMEIRRTPLSTGRATVASLRRGSSLSNPIATALGGLMRWVFGPSTISSPTSKKGRCASGSNTTAMSWDSRSW
jgi:4-hydroxyphenylpyruvate dioxygenase-like putative hemolysin